MAGRMDSIILITSNFKKCDILSGDHRLNANSNALRRNVNYSKNVYLVITGYSIYTRIDVGYRKRRLKAFVKAFGSVRVTKY